MQDPALVIPVILVMLIMGGCILAGLERPDGEDDSSFQEQRQA